MSAIRSGYTARLSSDREEIGAAMHVPIVRHINLELKGMPSKLDEHTLYITSGVVAQFVKRWNVVSPDTMYCTRDAYGQIVSTGQLISYARKR